MTDLKEMLRFEQSHFVREQVSFSDGGPLLETLDFFEINHGSYQPLKYLLIKLMKVCRQKRY